MKNPAADHHQIDLHTRYEFSVKVASANTKRINFVVCSRSLFGNSYDMHTLKRTIEQVADGFFSGNGYFCRKTAVNHLTAGQDGLIRLHGKSY